ncbi:MAG TPA: AIR synthase related protein [Galbitalea sp.]|nr:AIR synthase related protein [Galbitalea sp.]
MRVRRARDLVVAELGNKSIVIAADSNAATGDKPGDFLKQKPEITGYSAAKVPLMEVLACGAQPFLLVNNLGVDLATTGRGVLRGIRQLLDETSVDVLITGSDESNMPTVQTGVGVTVLGIIETVQLRVGRTQDRDEIWAIGRRRSGLSGDEYSEGVDGIATAKHVIQALQLRPVHEILPVGSKGIAYEAAELAREAGLRLKLRDNPLVDLTRSAGASTCFLVSCVPGTSSELDAIDLPRNLVGTLSH